MNPEIKTITPLPCAGLLYIQHRKLLLAFSNNKQCFYLPGGKINAGETAAEALCREVEEEMNVQLTEKELQWFTHISAPAFGEANGVIMEQECFMVTKDIKPVAAAEVGQLHFFTVEAYLREPNQAPGAVMILKILQQQGLID
ncbi:MAG: NUDIX domain-containing protein [Bacteroidetes bacterium]|nr:NUDIX domain-containing protein [Bacteroidota bacterium]